MKLFKLFETDIGRRDLERSHHSGDSGAQYYNELKRQGRLTQGQIRVLDAYGDKAATEWVKREGTPWDDRWGSNSNNPSHVFSQWLLLPLEFFMVKQHGRSLIPDQDEAKLWSKPLLWIAANIIDETINRMDISEELGDAIRNFVKYNSEKSEQQLNDILHREYRIRTGRGFRQRDLGPRRQQQHTASLMNSIHGGLSILINFVRTFAMYDETNDTIHSSFLERFIAHLSRNIGGRFANSEAITPEEMRPIVLKSFQDYWL